MVIVDQASLATIGLGRGAGGFNFIKAVVDKGPMEKDVVNGREGFCKNPHQIGRAVGIKDAAGGAEVETLLGV